MLLLFVTWGWYRDQVFTSASQASFRFWLQVVKLLTLIFWVHLYIVLQLTCESICSSLMSSSEFIWVIFEAERTDPSQNQNRSTACAASELNTGIPRLRIRVQTPSCLAWICTVACDWPLPVSVLSGLVIRESAVQKTKWEFCGSLWCFFIDCCDKMCGLLAAKQPGENATVEVMLRKAETSCSCHPRLSRLSYEFLV